jgi:large subunit ribosomal protein L15
MKYNDLQLKSFHSSKRVGRGIASGQGKTAGRGTKGQNARAGSSKKPGFEGGQNPLMQRLPKLKGFRSSAIRSELVYTGQLDKLDKATIDTQVLFDANIISSPFVKAKLLVSGSIAKKLHVKLPSASAAAIGQIIAKGGVFEVTPRVGRPKTSIAGEKKEGLKPIKK